MGIVLIDRALGGAEQSGKRQKGRSGEADGQYPGQRLCCGGGGRSGKAFVGSASKELFQVP